MAGYPVSHDPIEMYIDQSQLQSLTDQPVSHESPVVSESPYDRVYRCMNTLMSGHVYKISTMPREFRDLLTMYVKEDAAPYLDILYYMVITEPAYIHNIGYHSGYGLPLFNTILVPLLNHVINDHHRLVSVIRTILHCKSQGKYTDGYIAQYHERAYIHLISKLKEWMTRIGRKDLYKHFTDLPSTKMRSDNVIRWIRDTPCGPIVVTKRKARHVNA